MASQRADECVVQEFRTQPACVLGLGVHAVVNSLPHAQHCARANHDEDTTDMSARLENDCGTS